MAPAGVGATSSNQVSPGAFQDLYFTGDQGLLDVAVEEMPADALHAFLDSLPSPNTVAGWPDVGTAPPLQASFPAGVGSQASHSPSFRSIHTTPESSPATPLSRGSASLLPTSRTAAGAGARAAAGAGGDGDGGGRRGPRIMRNA